MKKRCGNCEQAKWENNNTFDEKDYPQLLCNGKPVDEETDASNFLCWKPRKGKEGK